MAPSLSPTSSRFGRVAVEDSILGFKTSAAFLASLSDNLRLNSTSPIPSPNVRPQSTPPLTEIPPLLPSNGTILLPPPPPRWHKAKSSENNTGSQTDKYRPTSRRNSIAKSPSRYEAETRSPADPRPLHDTHLTSFPATKTAALDLLRVTIRAQSFTALKLLFTHPLNLTCFALLLFLTDRLIRNALFLNPKKNPTLTSRHVNLIILIVWLSLTLIVTLAIFIALRLPYADLAAAIDDTWLGSDELIVATQDEASEGPLGVLILSYRVREIPGYSKYRRRRVGRGFIRGWAVAQSHRHQGVGQALLKEAARVVCARGGEGVWFVEEHAHAGLVLPGFYCGGFERREKGARRRLEGVWEWQKASSRRRGGG